MSRGPETKSSSNSLTPQLDILNRLPPHTVPSDDKAYDNLYELVSTIVHESGHEPYVKAGSVTTLLPKPVQLANGAIVTRRAVLRPNPGGRYSAAQYGLQDPRTRRSSLLVGMHPYQDESVVPQPYKSAAIVADRVESHLGVGGTLYAVTAGFGEYGLKPGRTLLVAQGAGNAALRDYPQPGEWDGMTQQRIVPDDIEQISRELEALLGASAADTAQTPNMIMQPPQLRAYPDVSTSPENAKRPFSNAPDYTTVWVR